MDGSKAQIENLKARLGHLSFNQKAVLGAVATASVISVAVFSLWLQTGDNAALFPSLGPVDATAALTEWDRQDIIAELATNEGSGSDRALMLRKDVETYLGEKASSMLDGVLGSGRSIVRVNADLNDEKIDREHEFFDPSATVVRSEVSNEEAHPSSGGLHEKNDTNYGINRTVEHVVGQAGGIKTLSVAVFIDGTYDTSTEGAPTYQPLGEGELDQLRRMVQTAVGMNAGRGDQIEIVNMQFRQKDQSRSLAVAYWLGLLSRYGGKIVLLITFMVIISSLKKNLAPLLSSASAAPGRVKTRQRGTAAIQEDLEPFDGIPERDGQVIGAVQDFAADNPERVADVIQSWLREADLESKAKQVGGLK